jgi:hypothetical protein
MQRTSAEEARATNGRGTITSLMTDILADFRQLIALEVKLAKDELREEVNKAKQSAISMSIGIGLIAVGGLLLLLMIVHFVQWLTQWPLWSCYAIVGAVLALSGWIAMKKGQRTAHEIDLMPKRTIQTTKETVSWLSEQTKSLKT